MQKIYLKLPNFFIIGAPKSGTTALYDAIKQHPGIFMSPVKEPHFFAFKGMPPISQGPAGSYFNRATVWELHKYALLFARASKEQAIGEASTTYLSSPLAAQRIRKNLPRSRIVAVLRHPADRAYSYYTFMRQNNVEPECTFESGLALEDKRKKEGWFSGLYYKTNGFYHNQLSVYYECFPRKQIKVYLYEDWRANPHAMLRDLFEYLEVDQGFMPETYRSNVTRLPKSRRLHRWATNLGQPERRSSLLNSVVIRPVSSALRQIDKAFNLGSPPPLDPETRARLTIDYREDILKLQDLIGRDLSSWLKS